LPEHWLKSNVGPAFLMEKPSSFLKGIDRLLDHLPPFSISNRDMKPRQIHSTVPQIIHRFRRIISNLCARAHLSGLLSPHLQISLPLHGARELWDSSILSPTKSEIIRLFIRGTSTTSPSAITRLRLLLIWSDSQLIRDGMTPAAGELRTSQIS